MVSGKEGLVRNEFEIPFAIQLIRSKLGQLNDEYEKLQPEKALVVTVYSTYHSYTTASSLLVVEGKSTSRFLRFVALYIPKQKKIPEFDKETQQFMVDSFVPALFRSATT